MRTNAFTVILASGLLAGCGLNAVRVQTAGEVAKLSSSVSESAKQIIDDAQRRRNQSLVSLIASDPSCEPTVPLLIFVPDEASPLPHPDAEKPAVVPPLCADGVPGTNPPGYKKAELDLSPLATEAVKPTIDLIAAVSAYGQALSKIVERPKTDISVELESVLALANKALAQTEILGDSGLPNIANLAENQKSTALALIQFAIDLQYERQQVKDIRILYPKYSSKLGQYCNQDDQGCVASGIYDELAQQVRLWSFAIAEGHAEINVGNMQRAYRRERNDLGFEGRRAFIVLVQDAAKEMSRIRHSSDQFEKAIVSLSKVNQELGRQLNNPSKKDREKAAAISRQRTINALSLILKAAAAWKGI